MSLPNAIVKTTVNKMRMAFEYSVGGGIVCIGVLTDGSLVFAAFCTEIVLNLYIKKSSDCACDVV